MMSDRPANPDPALAAAEAPRPAATAPELEPARCETCRKPLEACVCADLAPVQTKRRLVVLQHPQEQASFLGTGWLTLLQFPGSLLHVGLSWPNLARVAGGEVDARRWAVLYLGAASEFPREADRLLTLLDRKGKPLPEQDLILPDLEGIILLDATWAQAKTLWWRNPWMLKCRRLVLNPPRRSLYGQVRREPRRESLSTLEAAALVITTLDGLPETYERLVKPLASLVAKAPGATGADPAPQPAGRSRFRRKAPIGR